MTQPSYFMTPDGLRLAYEHYPATADNPGPGIFFLIGHNSDMYGTKADILKDWAIAKGVSFTRLDYYGHGLSDGSPADGTLSRWTEDAALILSEITSGAQILVGSSLGGWIMLNLALRMPERIAGLVGIAAAPDFTETLIWDALDDRQKQDMQTHGQIALPNPYSDEDVIYSYGLVTDGRQHLRLNAPIPFTGPVVLHQGMADHEVPWQTAIAIADKMDSQSVRINLLKAAGHRFSEPDQLDMIVESVAEMHQQLSGSED